MTTRREFIAAASAAAIMSSRAGNVLSGDQPRLHTRLIPGTSESLPIVGYGNSQAFRTGDLELSRQLVEILLGHGGSYIDAGGSSALLLAGIASHPGLRGRNVPGANRLFSLGAAGVYRHPPDRIVCDSDAFAAFSILAKRQAYRGRSQLRDPAAS